MRNQKETIKRIVGYLNNEEKDGGFWLPNIQRRFVWREDQIERLFDSIMREYPISTLLIWKTKSDVRHRKFIDNYKGTLKLYDFYIPENDKPKCLVLDGQQRLQSLFIGLRGSYEKKELFFDILSGDIVAPEDIRYKFKFMDIDIAQFPWIKFKDIVFSDEIYSRISKKIIDSCPIKLTDDQKERIEENIALVIQNFVNVEFIVYQELDSIDNLSKYNDDDIVEIFIRANAGGTKLGKSDLLFSLLTSVWDDADERMDELLDSLNKQGYEFNRDFILKTCLTLLGKGARYEVKKFRDDTTKDEIIEKWSEISNSIKEVKDYIYGNTFIRTDKAIPSYLGLIPVIYFRYLFSNKWKNVRELDTYFLRILLTGAFSGTPDNLIDKLTKHIKESGEFKIRDIFSIIRADGRNLEIANDTLLGQHYHSSEIHLIFNLWYREFNYEPSYSNNLPQIDHIFPQSLLRTVKDVSPDTGRKSIIRYKQFDRDQIANCMLLTAEENGAGGKGSRLPEEWFNDKDDEYLDMHLIPKDRELWKLENYEKFIEARKKLILEKFEYLLQKEIS